GGGDAGGADVVPSLGIPVVAVPISDGFQNAATVFDTNPPFADPNVLIGKYKYLYEQGVRKAAIVYLAVDQTRSEIEKQKPQMRAAGIEIVHENPLPLSTLSYDSAARGVANSGADYLFFVSDGGASASMARALHATGHQMKFKEYLTAYGTKFIELAGPGAEGSSSWIRTLPDEDGGSVPEQKTFIEWMGRVAPGDVRDTFAAESWVAAKAFFEALEDLPGPISREALIAQLKTLTEFDADGFFGRINLGGKRNNGCFVGMQVKGGKWVRLTPSQGFLC
ncbi:MAG: ABC transporter substrate-binding protein, partial [Actinomycetota bacterium]|nr:ABC transporter substrate-binding protein [Actinomycetota bacterium]